MKKEKKGKEDNQALKHFKQERPNKYMSRRFFALVLDFVLLALILELVFRFTGRPDWNGYFMSQDLVKGLSAEDPLVINRAQLYWECAFFSLIVCFIYESVMLLLFRATVGKMVLGFKVMDVKENRHPIISSIMLVLRAFIRVLSLVLLNGITFIVFCLSAYGNADSRSGFDIFTGTKVIDLKGDKK